jgi:hypothetical protein
MQSGSKQTAGFFVPAFFNVVLCKIQLFCVTLNAYKKKDFHESSKINDIVIGYGQGIS